jgi:hypothetical protein
LVNWQQEEPIGYGGGRQLSMDGTSRVSREAQARFCEGLGVKLPGATHPVICFQYREDAEKVMEVLPKRFAKYGLTLHPEKTRLLEFRTMCNGEGKTAGSET